MSQQNRADLIGASFVASLGTFVDSSVTIGPVHMSYGQDGLDPVAVIGNTTWVGGRLLSSTSPNVAVLCKKTTALGGRRNRGRFYLPWIVASTTINETGVVASSEVTSLQTKATLFKTDMAGAGATSPMVILHQSGSTTPALVTALTIDARVATQRRRTGR